MRAMVNKRKLLITVCTILGWILVSSSAWGTPPPTGTYQKTCKNIKHGITSHGKKWLQADCRNYSGRYKFSRIHYGRCVGNFANMDGVLSCRGKYTRSGSYLQTCRNPRRDPKGGFLRAVCKDKRGRWVKTSMTRSRQKSCMDDISNKDGKLYCKSMRDKTDPPPGSYKKSCRQITATYERLRAFCKNKRGRWRITSLKNFQSCVGDIGNNNGRLTCRRSR